MHVHEQARAESARAAVVNVGTDPQGSVERDDTTGAYAPVYIERLPEDIRFTAECCSVIVQRQSNGLRRPWQAVGVRKSIRT